MNSGSDASESRELLPGLNRCANDSTVRITFRWFYGTGTAVNKVLEIVLLLLGIIVDVVTFNGVIRIFSVGANFSQAFIDGFFFITGFILAYRGLLLLVNRSTFEISENNLSVLHGPLPGGGNLCLPVYEIDGVEWQKVGQTHNSGNRLASGYSALFNVILRTTAGKTVTLVSGIHAREYAFAISSEITKALK